ncbi:meiotic recombination protein REC8 [Biomphalaria glabrata]|nr:meiotic recombination protein REC8 [Biomphalaria glabrata]
MFYSHIYLKRNGRFGLIWLAATQTRVLTKRELHVVNISATCSDILEHITGYSSKETYKRPKRFSLYLSSQLMYGSVIVLNKQWEFLLAEVSALLRRVHPENVTGEIDLVVSSKHDVSTLESCVPLSIKDKHYDPFFGVNKESTVDVDRLLESWDRNFTKHMDMQLLDFPQLIKPELGSPHSVSDPLEIQISDKHIQDLSPMLPGEQDLPALDYENLLLLQHSSEEIFLSSDESPGTLVRSPAACFTGTSPVIERHRSTNELTPSVKAGGELPETPQKKKKRHHSPDRKKGPKGGDADTSLPWQEELVMRPTSEGAGNMLDSTILDVTEAVSPIARLTHDWLQKELPILQLTPLLPRPSPARKRKPSKVILDSKIQLQRSEMKNNMLTASDTTIPMTYSEPPEKEYMKNIGSLIFDNPLVLPLWTKGCKFGILTYETESESSSFTSPIPRATGTKRKLSPNDSPEEVVAKRKSSTIFHLTSSSIEHQRAATSTSLAGEDRSHSIVALSGDESLTTSARKSKSPLRDQAFSSIAEQGFVTLPSLQEEHEALLSPPALLPEDITVEELPRASLRISPSAEFMKWYKTNEDKSKAPVTFKKLYPPSTSRLLAAKMFMELLIHAALMKVKVFQEIPYGDIFITEVKTVG